MKYTAAVITISDKGARGERIDTSGPAISAMLEEAGYEVAYTNIIPDDFETIKAELIQCADTLNIALVVTTGGTGFSPRDVTPEATLAVIQRETPGIPEQMRAESLKITNRACLSRSVAGIRSQSLIVNLPGSKKAACENLQAVLSPISHGLDMLYSSGSADCAASDHVSANCTSANYGTGDHTVAGLTSANPAFATETPQKKSGPSMDAWLKEAKSHPSAPQIGMYLTHNGIVRETAKAKVRSGAADTKPVTGMLFSYDAEKAAVAVEETYKLPGIYYVRIWLNEGQLQVGDDIMYVLIGGDIRPHVVDGLQFLVGKLKSECVSETELN